MITINQEQCIGCGACIKDCPGNALTLTEGKASSIRDCIHCGHCVAICPVKAVSIPEYDMEDVEEYEKETFSVSPTHLLHAIKFRRSIRNFTQEPLSRETLTHILNAGRYTATAKNMQDCRFIVVQEQLEELKSLVWQELPSILEKLEAENSPYFRPFRYFYKLYQRDSSVNQFFFNCTAFLVIASSHPLDGGLAAANIENMAVAEGAGVLYSGYLQNLIIQSPVLQKWLGIEEKQIACCMLLGYPNVTYKRTAPRKKADILWK